MMTLLAKDRRESDDILSSAVEAYIDANHAVITNVTVANAVQAKLTHGNILVTCKLLRNNYDEEKMRF